MPDATPAEQLDGFLAKFDPAVERQAREALDHLRQRAPGAVQLVYDNYNALAIAFAARESLSSVVFSVAVYPRWVSLFFVGGQAMDDPHRLLKGTGATMRHVVLKDAEVLASEGVEALIAQALARADPPLDPDGPGRLVIKSVSAKQRPRRPAR